MLVNLSHFPAILHGAQFEKYKDTFSYGLGKNIFAGKTLWGSAIFYHWVAVTHIALSKCNIKLTKVMANIYDKKN